MYREIIAVCSQIHTKHINTLCGQNVELLNVKLGGTYSDQWALNSHIKCLYIKYIKSQPCCTMFVTVTTECYCYSQFLAIYQCTYILLLDPGLDTPTGTPLAASRNPSALRHVRRPQRLQRQALHKHNFCYIYIYIYRSFSQSQYFIIINMLFCVSLPYWPRLWQLSKSSPTCSRSVYIVHIHSVIRKC